MLDSTLVAISAIYLCSQITSVSGIESDPQNSRLCCGAEKDSFLLHCSRRGGVADCSKKDEVKCSNEYQCKSNFFGGYFSNFLLDSNTLRTLTCRCNSGSTDSLTTRSDFCGEVLDSSSINSGRYFTSSIRFHHSRNIFDFYALELMNAIVSNMSVADSSRLSGELLKFVCLFTYPHCTTCVEGGHAYFGLTQQYHVCYDPRPCWSACSKAMELHSSVKYTVYHCLNGNTILCPNISKYLRKEKISVELRRRNQNLQVSNLEFCKLENVCEQKSISGGLNLLGNNDIYPRYFRDPWITGTISSVLLVCITTTVSLIAYFTLLYHTDLGLPNI